LTISSKTIEDSVLTTTSVFNIQNTLKGNKFIIDKESAPILAFNTETAKIEGKEMINSKKIKNKKDTYHINLILFVFLTKNQVIHF